MTRHKALVTTLHAGDLVGYLTDKVDVHCATTHDPMERDELLTALEDKDALISIVEDRIDAALLDRFPQLKVVGNVAVGYDNIDVEAATKRGVLICNTPGVLDATTADLAFALLMAVARRVVESDKYVREGKWQKWTSDLFLGTDVSGKTLGIIGMGRIGTAMARRGRGFDMKIQYFQRNRVHERTEAELGGATHVDLATLLSTSDFISVHCPLNKQTFHLLGKEQFAMLKPGAILINTARGAVIDEPAMIEALQSGKIAGAGLDVFEKEPQVPQELCAMPNVVVTPHIGSASVETRAAMARLAADGVLNALAGRLPANAVNPEVWESFTKRMKEATSCA